MMNSTTGITRKTIVKGGIVAGLALMASYFGSGNLVIGSQIGFAAGDKWGTALVAFLIAAVVFPICSFLAVVKSGGTFESIALPMGRKTAKILIFLYIVPLMPILGIPRLVAIGYEMGMAVLFPNFPLWLFGLLFLGLGCVLTLNFSKFVDRIGSFLSPFLIIALAIIVIKAIFAPVSSPASVGATRVFGNSLITGYATGDAGASLMFAGAFMLVIREKINRGAEGQSLSKEQYRVAERKMTSIMLVVCGLIIGFIYGGMCYLGACGTSILPQGTDSTTVTVRMVYELLGTVGSYIFSFAVFLACFTTVIGTVASISSFVSGITGGKLKYIVCVFLMYGVSLIFSRLSVAALIYMVIIINSVTYPMIIILTILTFIKDKLPQKRHFGLYWGAVGSALLFGLIEQIGVYGNIPALQNFFNALPLKSISFEWLIPTVICSVLGFLLIPQPENFDVEGA